MTKDLEFLIDIVKGASSIITDDFVVDPKGNAGDLVTTYDYEVEKYLISHILEAYPDFDIVSEEFNSKKELTSNCFTIDPIDGTVNFAHGIPLWVIQVCMIRNGSPCASVIYAPKINEMYTADTEHAYLNGNIINALDSKPSSPLLAIEGKLKYSLLNKAVPTIPHARVFGSAGLDYAFVASGRATASVFNNETVWDYTPGLHIAHMAHAYIVDRPHIHIASSDKELLHFLENICEELI